MIAGVAAVMGFGKGKERDKELGATVHRDEVAKQLSKDWSQEVVP